MIKKTKIRSTAKLTKYKFDDEHSDIATKNAISKVLPDSVFLHEAIVSLSLK